MGEIQTPDSVLLVFAMSSRYSEELQWAHDKIALVRGKVAISSPPYEFTETDYYAPTMGNDLKKQFLAFERLIDPGELAAIKRQTNEWEVECAALGRHPESRPLNLDPGYITPAKLVLASTKDHAHRIYIGEGIYAEVTLSYRGGRWRPQEWTYPDYRREDYQQFFDECRRLALKLRVP
jgi:hypothetical protein